MTKSTPDTLEIAKQENAQALATLMNRWLKPRGMTAKATREGNCLHVIFEANQVPNLKVLITFIRKVILNLGVVAIKTVKISVYLPGETSPVCYEEIELKPQAKLLPDGDESITPAGSWEIAEPTTNKIDQSVGAVAKVQPPNWLDTKREKMLVILPVFIVASALLLFNFKREPSLPTQSVPASATSSPSANFFGQAVNQATRASSQAQTAKTQQEWNSIANQWQEAQKLMQAVPVSDPKHKLAQQKVKEYQRKLEYAQQKAKTSP
ncbi:MAG: hypothetical protein KME19_15260 [Microcoleus vaginatus WJT46-NPBG5]|jgi:hypothetical protein|nr:hypothetical protein [Microcoleus vaginatus WJT46-NPBG5]